MEDHSSDVKPASTTGGRTNEPRQLSENTPLLTNTHIARIEESSYGDPSSYDSKKVLFWKELVTLTNYAAPVFVTGGLEFSLIVVSVITIGHISTTALAAITLGSMTAGVTAFSIIQGLVSALDTLLPPAWTSPQPQLVGLWTQRMTVVVLISLMPMSIIWLNAEALLIYLNQDPEVARLAAIYLRWMLLGLPAYGFNCISRRYFQSQGLFTVPTRIILFVAPLNALLNYLLMWGPPPIRLGFIGAPIATAISMNFISLLSILYGVIYTPRTAWHPLSRRMFTSLGVITKLGLSGVGQTASEWWAWELVALAASQLGPVALAAQSVLLVSASATYQAPYALSIATAVRIGNLLGERKAKHAGIAAYVAIAMTALIASFTSTMFLVFRYKWAYIFNDDPQVVELVSSVMPLLALFQVFDGLAGVTGGILRARGKQFTGALLNLRQAKFPLSYAVPNPVRHFKSYLFVYSGYYMLGIPMGIYFAFWLKLGLHGLWLGLTFSLVYAAFFGTWIAMCTNWDSEVTKVMQRLKDEDRASMEERESRIIPEGLA